MRRGEILSLQWHQLEGMRLDGTTITWAPKAELFLPKEKTKTSKDRRVPISTRLKAILEMRRLDPAGQPQALDAFVFGSEIGTRLAGFKRAWLTAVLKAHGVTPTYTKGANLTPASREALRLIDLHFHDLRREAGSRWMDAGVPIATIQRWLGHENVSQTSTYLAGSAEAEHAAMARFEAHQAASQQLATEGGKGGQTRPRSAAGRKEKPNKNAVGRARPLM
jgi:integrase